MNNNIQTYYEVETILWKNPIDPAKDIFVQKKNNIYYDCREFHNERLYTARCEALSYAHSMVEVLCESIGKPYLDEWQARRELQQLFRHERKGRKDGLLLEDYMCGVTARLVVQRGKKRDIVDIYSISQYDEGRPYEVAADLIFCSIELARERRYYSRLLITEGDYQVVDFAPVGGIKRCILTTPTDWQEFIAAMQGIDLFDALEETLMLQDRLADPLLVAETGLETLPDNSADIITYEDRFDTAYRQG